MFNLMPKDSSFYDQLERLTETIVAAVDELLQVLDRRPNSADLAAAIESKRHEAHVWTRETLRRLDEAFITPFDREDILQLANDLYRVTVGVANAAERIECYGMKDIDSTLREQGAILRNVVQQVDVIVHQLRRSAGLSEVRPQLDSIGQLEEQSRRQRTAFFSGLFRGAPDPLSVMKKRELNDLLTDAVGACDNVGRTIEQVLIKNH
jgi:uncharacterized protein Yka (UPF0111/DUF47 family)